MEEKEFKKYKENELPKIIFQWNDLKESEKNLEKVLENTVEYMELAGIDRVVINECSYKTTANILNKLSNRGFKILNVIKYEDFMLESYLEKIKSYEGISNSLVIDMDKIQQNADSYIEEAINKFKNLDIKNYSFTFKFGRKFKDYVLKKVFDIYVKYNISSVLEPKIDIFGESIEDFNWSELNEIYTYVISHQAKLNTFSAVFIKSGVLPTRLLNMHPCNCYMCHSGTCHSGKKDICRKLIVTETGDVYPESRDIDSKFKIGNLVDNNLVDMLKAYENSIAHNKFKEVAKKCFFEYIQVCSFKVVPWTELFVSIISR